MPEARAKEIEIRAAKLANKLCDTEEALASMSAIVGMVRTEMSGVPARVTRDLNVRRQIEDAIRSGLNRVADRLRREASALRETGRAASWSEEYVQMQHVTTEDFLRTQDRMLAAIDSLEREFDAAVRQIAEETDPVEREAVAMAEYE